MTSVEFCRGKIFEETVPRFCSMQTEKWALVTDTHVYAHYQSLIRQSGLEVFVFPAGEIFKTRETKAQLEDFLFAQGIGRAGGVIGLGGGVVCDLTSFTASTFCRGIRLCLIPTTLLAMLDACLGGKTAVNTPFGKNSIGTFYPPEQVWIDPLFLETLPPRELRSGSAEAVKYGAIGLPALFDRLEQGLDGIEWEPLIQSCLTFKQAVVAEDPFEKKGTRRLLNYGHTLGHALEKLEDFQIRHGEAVAIGMVGAAYISHRMGILSSEEVERMEKVCRACQLPMKLAKIHSTDQWKEALQMDKKASGHTPRFVLLEKIGTPLPFQGNYCTPIDPSLLEETLQWLNRRFT